LTGPLPLGLSIAGMSYHHPSRTCAWALASALVLCGGLAQAAQAHHRATVAPARHVAGLTGDELLGESWAARLVLPAENPFVGGCQRLGRGRPVLSPVIGDDDTATCAAGPGERVFLRFGSFCDDVEPPPFFGADPGAQRACAIALDESVVSERIAVDGGTPVEIRKPRFELIGPQRTVQLPPDNFVGVPPQAMTFVAHAWGAVVSGLSPGRHAIAFEITTTEFTATVTVYVKVVRRA
jgi:hypothetical protein